MLAILESPERADAIARLAKPALLPGGLALEERVVFGGTGWAGYFALDENLGPDRPGPRIYYLGGDLEIMSASGEHERIKSNSHRDEPFLD